MVRHRNKGQTDFLNALSNHAAQYSFDCPETPPTGHKLDELIRDIQQFVPSSGTVAVQKSKPVAAKVKDLLQLEDYAFCSKYVLLQRPH